MRTPVGLLMALQLVRPLSAQEVPAPLGPEEALKTFRLPDGFRIELVAAEPHVLDPVAMAFDPDGAIWVAEMGDYPLGPVAGRIRRLEDRDGDGRVERATTFATGLPFPTGVMPFRGGVLVTAAPDILFLKDDDGDGRADVRQVVFTGFKEGNQQHRVNGLQYGLDNWIYGTNGDSGGAIRAGGDPAAPAVSISGRDFRFRADFSGFEPASGHGQYANTFDDWGRRFINDNSNHLRHPVLPLRALARHPAAAVGSVEDSISDHGPACRVFPTSRLQARPNDHHAANHFTSACSVTIFRAEGLGVDVRGDAFTCEPVHNLVHRDRLEPRGASFTAKRVHETSEFLTSTDNWFRPVNLAVGPDGALYVVDMYRAVIEHPQWIPLEMQKRVDVRAGADRGRIWRVVRDGAKPAPRPRLSTASPSELIAHLESGNAGWRLGAQQRLVELRDPSSEEPLRALARGSKTPLGRLHALRTLEGTGRLTDDDVRAALKDPEAELRAQGLQLAESRMEALKDDVLAMGGDPSPRVRFQLALALGEVGGEEIVDPLAAILERDSADRWTRLAALTSMKGILPRMLARLRGPLDQGLPGGIELVRGMADAAAASKEAATVVDWLKAATGDAPSRWRLTALASLGLPLRRARMDLSALAASAGVRDVVETWNARLLETALEPAREAAERVAAIEFLALLPVEGQAAKIQGLIRPQEPPEVQAAAVRALGAEAAAGLLDGWAAYTGPVRREVLSACFSRPEGAERVVERLEQGKIRAVELEAGHRDQLLKHPSAGIRERARAALKPKGSEEIEAAIEATFAKVAKLTADPVAGEKVFLQSCATCHRLHGQGYDVGPNLASVAGRDAKSLLTDLLNPNRAVAPQYQVYVVKTPAGETLSGIVAAETPASVTLRRANAEETTVQRKDLVEIKAWPASMMPEGLENSLSAQNFADLLEFLRRGQTK